MHCVSRLLRANTPSSSLRACRPVFSTPPSLVYPTKPARSFSATPTHFKFVVPKRKQQVKMPSDMTTFKGKPFDRASLESVMKVRACILPSSYAPRRVILTSTATTLLHTRLRHLRRCLWSLRLWPARYRPHKQHCRRMAEALCAEGEHAGG
jgi:hypothetical protein